MHGSTATYDVCQLLYVRTIRDVPPPTYFVSVIVIVSVSVSVADGPCFVHDTPSVVAVAVAVAFVMPSFIHCYLNHHSAVGVGVVSQAIVMHCIILRHVTSRPTQSTNMHGIALIAMQWGEGLCCCWNYCTLYLLYFPIQ